MLKFILDTERNDFFKAFASIDNKRKRKQERTREGDNLKERESQIQKDTERHMKDQNKVLNTLRLFTLC